MEYVLKTFDLCKSYKRHQVLNKVNMNIAKGDIYGFVGENGSGKTTIIRLITGLISPNGGHFELFGVNNNYDQIRKVKSKMNIETIIRFSIDNGVKLVSPTTKKGVSEITVSAYNSKLGLKLNLR